MVRKAEKSWAYAEEINEKTSAEKVTWDQEKGNGGRVLDGERKFLNKLMKKYEHQTISWPYCLNTSFNRRVCSYRECAFVGDMNYFQNGKGDGDLY